MSQVCRKATNQNFPLSGLICLLLALSTVVLASCSEPQPKIDPELLNYKSPLGYNWQLDETVQAKVKTAQEERCEPNPEYSGDSPKVIQYLSEQSCMNTTLQSRYFQSTDIFGQEKYGYTSLITKKYSEAVIVEYSYLHHFLLEGETERQIKRNALAKRLKKELIRLYGKPIASRYYSQRSEEAFLAYDQTVPICFHWQEQNIGIMLCPQRHIGIDGTEMSLSFVNLEEAPDNRVSRAMAAVSDNQYSFEDRALPHGYARHYIGSDSILLSIEDWLDSDKFKNCRKDTAPFSKFVNIPKNLIDLVQSDIKPLSGDALANYGIEIINEDEFDLSDSERDQLAVYLLDQAAKQGSAIGKNEIGYALLNCNFGIKQNIAQSVRLLQESAALDDVYAKLNLAKLHLAGLTNEKDPLNAAVKLLEECADAGNKYCATAQLELDMYIKSDYPKPQFENSKVFE